MDPAILAGLTSSGAVFCAAAAWASRPVDAPAAARGTPTSITAEASEAPAVGGTGAVFGAIAAGIVAMWTTTTWWVVIGMLFVGAFVGARWDASRAVRRQREIARAVPTLVDMLLGCLGAGMSLDQALRRVEPAIGVASPALSRELTVLVGELDAGLGREQAFDRLAARVGVPELTSLVAVLSQAQRHGTGVGTSLSAFAQLARRRRLLQAEQRAASASPRLTVVLILGLLPPLFIILVGPAMLRLTAFVGGG